MDKSMNKDYSNYYGDCITDDIYLARLAQKHTRQERRGRVARKERRDSRHTGSNR